MTKEESWGDAIAGRSAKEVLALAEERFELAKVRYLQVELNKARAHAKVLLAQRNSELRRLNHHGQGLGHAQLARVVDVPSSNIKSVLRP